ncbi:MAG: helix-turn-helix transcriptional regulator [Lachnospiraceae bacterium]|nr:helix-turn-helix transcriptional regulator [Lachnospiraceae bacterium]
METGTKIRKYRKRSGMTDSELAKKTYLSPASICNYEKNRRDPNLLELVSIAKVLNVRPIDLLPDWFLEVM